MNSSTWKSADRNGSPEKECLHHTGHESNMIHNQQETHKTWDPHVSGAHCQEPDGITSLTWLTSQGQVEGSRDEAATHGRIRTMFITKSLSTKHQRY